MENKFTRKIDEMFKKYGKGDEKMLLIGWCHSGDEDGGTDDYEEWDMWECNPYERSIGYDEAEFLFSPDESMDDEFEKDYDELSHMLHSSFGNVLDPDYTHTNCYWWRYYAVTKDHEIVTWISRGDIFDKTPKVLKRLTSYSEDEAEQAADKQLLGKISYRVSEIQTYLSRLKYDENKKEAIKEIKTLIKE